MLGPAVKETGSSRLAIVNISQNLVVLNLRDLGTLPGFFAEWVSDLCVLLGDFDKTLEEFFVHSFVDVDSGRRSADLEYHGVRRWTSSNEIQDIPGPGCT